MTDFKLGLFVCVFRSGVFPKRASAKLLESGGDKHTEPLQEGKADYFFKLEKISKRQLSESIFIIFLKSHIQIHVFWIAQRWCLSFCSPILTFHSPITFYFVCNNPPQICVLSIACCQQDKKKNTTAHLQKMGPMSPFV